MRNSVAANIPKLFILQALRWFMLILPTMVLFFQENGLNLKEVFLLQAIFSVSIVVLEVPTGYFADVFGRKLSLVIGTAFSFLGLLIYCFAHEFWGFLAAEITLGLGAAFVSGSDSALLYDSLLELGRKKEYKRLAGLKFSVSGVSEGVGSVLGGLLAAVSFRLPFYVETGIMLGALLLSLTLVEPRGKRFQHPEGSLKGILSILHFSFRGNPRLKWTLFYSAAIGSSTLTMYWFWQPYFKSIGLPLAWFGAVFAGLQFWMSFVSHQAHRMEAWVGEKAALVSFLVLITVGFMAASRIGGFAGFLVVALFYFVRGFNTPLFSDYVNRLVPSDMRATVLSLEGLLVRLIFSIFGPLAGRVADAKGLPSAFVVSGVFFAALGGFCLFGLFRNRNRVRR